MNYRAFLVPCAVLFLASTADAQRLYKWVDKDGNVTYSDQVPPSEVEREREELNPQGVAVNRVERALTAEERASLQAERNAQAQAQREAEEQTRKDHVLLASYPSEGDLERAFRERFELLANVIKNAQTGLASQEKSLSELLAHAAQLEQSGKPVPANVKASIETARRQTDEQRSFMQKQRDEEQALRIEYEQTLGRYRELTAKYAEQQG